VVVPGLVGTGLMGWSMPGHRTKLERPDRQYLLGMRASGAHPAPPPSDLLAQVPYAEAISAQLRTTGPPGPCGADSTRFPGSANCRIQAPAPPARKDRMLSAVVEGMDHFAAAEFRLICLPKHPSPILYLSGSVTQKLKLEN